MDEWRTLGYVPDSDSDEEDIDSPQLPLSTTAKNQSPKAVGTETTSALQQLKSSPQSSHEPSPSPVATQAPSAVTRNPPTQRDADFLPSLSQILESKILSSSPGDVPKSEDNVETNARPGRPFEIIFSSSQPETNTFNDVAQSQSSSPLSSARSVSPVDSLDESHNYHLASSVDVHEESRTARAVGTANKDGNEPGHPQEPDDLLEHTEGVWRSKRRRNAVQMAPFSVEARLYEQSLKSRGLKPVRVAWSQALISPQKPEPKRRLLDRDEDYEEEHSASTEDVRRQLIPVIHIRDAKEALPANIPSSNAADVFDIPLDEDDVDAYGPPQNEASIPDSPDDDTLPDIHTILQKEPLLPWMQKKPRRKLKPIYHKANSRKPVDVVSATSKCGPESLSENISLDTLDSPPLSSPSLLPYVPPPPSATFHVPRLGSLQPLPTPATSSEPQRLHHATELTTSPGNPSENHDEIGQIEPRRQRSQSPLDIDSQQVESRRLQKLQRRIKGVLPASWLKLDQQAQKHVPKSSTARGAGRGREQARGIARKISPNRRNRRRSPIVISDGSSDFDEDSVSRADESRASLDDISEVTFENPTNFEDIPEDNRVDYMLPSTSRPRKRRKTQKRQTKLQIPSTAPPVGRNREPLRPSWNKTKQPRITQHLSEKRELKSRRSPPALSVIDSTDVQRSRNIPQFLKIAARKARSRKNQGRHRPTRKFIRLGTREDTEDANHTLNQWRSGNIRRRDSDILSGQSIGDVPASAISPRQEEQRRPTSAGKSPDSAPLAPLFDRAAKAHRSKKSTHMPAHDDATRKKPANQPSKKGHLVSSLRVSNVPRTAQMESASASRQNPTIPITRTLSSRNLQLHSAQTQDGSYLLSKFLQDHVDVGQFQQRHEPTEQPHNNSAPKDRTLKQNKKKKLPKRVDTEVIEVRQPVQPSIELDDFDDSSTGIPASGCTLTGFGNLGVTFTLDFDVTALQPGTFFHQSTFIGSGELLRSLTAPSRDLDSPSGFSFFLLNNRSYRWGPWNETVSTELGDVFQSISEVLDHAAATRAPPAPIDSLRISNPSIALKAVISYVASHLSFIDFVDKLAFSNRMCRLLRDLSLNIRSGQTYRQPAAIVPVAMYALVLANQVRLIVAPSRLAEVDSDDDVESLISIFREELLSLITSDTALKEIELFHESNKRYQKREAGIRDDEIFVTAIVTLFHVYQAREETKDLFWSEFSSQLTLSKGFSLQYCTDVQKMEKVWSGLFTILPLLELDSSGIFRHQLQSNHHLDNWAFVQKLVQRITEPYIQEPSSQPAAFNAYFRTILARCFHLIKYWRWNKCERILDTFFDFFAKLNLSNLRNEDPHGSPAFLQELDKDPCLNVEPPDRSFHLLLKAIAEGLRGMRGIYKDSKIRSIIWRLIPNHGRSYPKDKPIRQVDLDALRNQHDLLCVLYWTSPPGFRPRLTTIRSLVHPMSSHREACSINLHSWARLVRFKLSTDETPMELVPFADWHDDFVTQMLEQHVAARTEAESAFVVLRISNNFLESTIAQNQRQIEALLADSLLFLANAFNQAKTFDQATFLLTPKGIPGVFGLLDAKNNRVNALIIQALDALLAYMRIWQSRNQMEKESTSVPSDDSQEFGDWSGFDEVCQISVVNRGIQHLHDVVYDSMIRLVSNCFGSDVAPEDALLHRIIDTWIVTAHAMVKEGLKGWENYFGSYDRESWASLRETDQTKKFAPLFFAGILEKDTACYEENKDSILKVWISCIVERESMLKFQHRLMSAVLNVDRQNLLFSNLPFTVDSRSDKYDIQLDEFRQRRINLISTVLSNMRVSAFEANCQSRIKGQEVQQEYRELILQLMTTMKSRYQELGPEDTAKGAYVDFVHRVVEFLQQHTVEICPVDRFFTDSTAFPLPANDPSYVVGRLRNYGLRLSDPGVPKQLVTFVQNVAERAAGDEKQAYFTNQLHAAMSGTYEAGCDQRPTLRSFLLLHVFPAYIELPFENIVAWAIVAPVLEAIQQTLDDLILDVDFNDEACLHSVITMLQGLFEALYMAVDKLQLSTTDHHARSIQTQTVSMVLLTVTSTFPVLEYVLKSSDVEPGLLCYIQYFKKFREFVTSDEFLDGHLNPTDSSGISRHTPTRWRDVRPFASRELRNTLRRNWSMHDGRIYVQRGANSRKQLDILSDGPRADKEDLAYAVKEFENGIEAFGFGMGEEEHAIVESRMRRMVAGLDELFI